MNLNEAVNSIRKNFELIVNELAKIIVGQDILIKHIFICLLCCGHTFWFSSVSGMLTPVPSTTTTRRPFSRETLDFV